MTDPHPACITYCHHCGYRIYQDSSRRWFHTATQQSYCIDRDARALPPRYED